MARLARINHARASAMVARLAQVPGVTIVNEAFFNEVTVKLTRPGSEVIEELAERGVLGGVALDRLYPGIADLRNAVLVTASELTDDADIETLADELAQVLA